jgi:N-formylmaleamate deformylase
MLRRNSFSVIAALVVGSHVAGQSQPATTQTQPASQPAKPSPFTPIAHAEKRGDGPIVMVLIPGLSCDWTVFDAFMQRNQHKYTMHALTLPGFGGSDGPSAPGEGDPGAWLDNADAAVWKYVQDQKLDHSVIVGHSLGGFLALRLGTEHAGDLRAVVTIDGLPAFPLPTLDPNPDRDVRREFVLHISASLQSMTNQQWNDMQRQTMTNLVTDPARARALADMCAKSPPGNSIRYMLDIMDADIISRMPLLKCPALALAAAPSAEPTDIEGARRIWAHQLQNAPAATLVVFENTRHFIQEDRPAEVDAAIADFLAGRPVKGFKAPATQPATEPATQPASKPTSSESPTSH